VPSITLDFSMIGIFIMIADVLNGSKVPISERPYRNSKCSQ
jgi:hypothetical protein